MCSCSFRPLISLSSFTFAVLAWLLARLELRNVSFGPLTIRICLLHHRFSTSVSSLSSTTLSAAFFAALTALAVRILTVIPLVSGSPLRFSSWSSCLRAMVRLYGVSSSGTAAVSSSSGSSLPSLLQTSFNLLPLHLASRFFRRQPHQEHGPCASVLDLYRCGTSVDLLHHSVIAR